MCHWRRRHFEIVTVALLCMVVYSNLPLSSALFGWLQGKKRVTNAAAQLDRDALEAEKTGEELVHHSSANRRGPDGCGHKLKTALAVVKAYGASFKHWHWPWRKKKKTNQNNQINGEGRKRREMDEHLRVIDHCAAIAEREEYQRGHFGHAQRRRRQRRGARLPRPREMDDKSALKTLARMLKTRKSKALSAADHWTNIGLIRWGRRTIRNIRRPATLIKHRQNAKNGKVSRKKGSKNIRRRRIKRGDEEEEEEEGEETDDEEGDGGRSSSEEESANGTKFKYTKMAHGYSRDDDAGSNANDRIYETVSFEAEHPEKGHYTQRTTTQYKFHGPKHSEWRHRPPKAPKAEGRAWTGKFKSRRRAASRKSVHLSRKRGRRKSRRGRWRRKKNLADYGGGDYYYYTVAHLPTAYSYGHYYDYGNPWWNT
ncbi:hypothetical protein niasHT_034004 [Heterodera trifolii]|uniref:Effector protein n=1 Tax=Heterodera trifolii TaxID=157864 RepID=A0ABD2J5M4_9BILA